LGNYQSRPLLLPLVAVAYDGELPVYYLSPIDGGAAGFDSLGESGQRQPLAFLEGAARVWRSRRAAAPGGLLVAADPAARQATAWRLPSDRFLPVGLRREASRRLATGRLLFAGLAGLLLLGCLWRAGRVVRSRTSQREG
jgi:hypothetical protein